MERFKFIRRLGRGTHGIVYLLETTDGTGTKIVCKSVLDRYQRHAEREIAMLSSLSHKRVVKMLESFRTNTGTFIILEYANHGTLQDMLNFLIQRRCKATMYMIWSVLAQVSDALMYLHSKKIIHRDVKPSNILINQLFVGEEGFFEFKLCDFSLARRFDDAEEHMFGSVVGTPSYIAPEVIDGDLYDTSVDVWGLGVTLYELAMLSKPFRGRCRRELYESIKEARIPSSPICTDKTLEELIRRCLCKDNRISVRSIIQNDRIRLHLAMIEIKLREHKIQSLERELSMLKTKKE